MYVFFSPPPPLPSSSFLLLSPFSFPPSLFLPLPCHRKGRSRRPSFEEGGTRGEKGVVSFFSSFAPRHAVDHPNSRRSPHLQLAIPRRGSPRRVRRQGGRVEMLLLFFLQADPVRSPSERGQGEAKPPLGLPPLPIRKDEAGRPFAKGNPAVHRRRRSRRVHPVDAFARRATGSGVLDSCAPYDPYGPYDSNDPNHEPVLGAVLLLPHLQDEHIL